MNVFSFYNVLDITKLDVDGMNIFIRAQAEIDLMKKISSDHD